MLKSNFGICDKELRSVSFGSTITRHQGLPKEYYNAPKCVYEDRCYIVNPSSKLIEEGLIQTYPTEFLIKKIIQVVRNNGVVLTKEHFETEEPNDDNSISGIIMFGIPFAYASKKLHDELNQCFNLCGYYCSQMVYENEAKLILFQVEPKFQTKKTQPTLGRYIYHITTKAAANKIIKNGFFPKRATKTELGYDPRIFFLPSIVKISFCNI